VRVVDESERGDPADYPELQVLLPREPYAYGRERREAAARARS